MNADDIVPILIALYVLWSIVQAIFSTQRKKPPIRERADSHARQPVGGTPTSRPPAPPPRRKHAPPRAHERTGGAYGDADPWEKALADAKRRDEGEPPPSHLASAPGRPATGEPTRARSRARALLGNRRALVRGIVAQEILGPPVSERQRRENTRHAGN